MLAVMVAAMVVLGAAPAMADPAGPTDYTSEFIEIDPPLSGFEVEVIGGDAFVRLVVEEGTQVEVVGYSGEPYLLFKENGEVFENELAPTTYTNQDRYAIVEIPARASASAAPEWQLVSTDGAYSWHDHRAHWMNPEPPPGAHPGDQILEGVVPILVDGTEVDLTVISVWEEDPSVVPVLAGALIGILIGWLGARTATIRWVVAGLAVAATTIAGIAFLSVPAETAPSVVMVLVPVSAFVLALVARESVALVAVASLELVVWGVVRWDWMWKAIIPTVAPHWLDRSVTAVTLAGATVLTVYQLGQLFGGFSISTERSPSPRPQP